jgi:hypothetical protein
MNNVDPVVTRELPVIQKIIADETWLEGERRGGYVSPEDPVVQEHVCAIVLSVGGELRELFQDSSVVQVCPAVATDRSSHAA